MDFSALISFNKSNKKYFPVFIFVLVFLINKNQFHLKYIPISLICIIQNFTIYNRKRTQTLTLKRKKTHTHTQNRYISF